MMMQEHEGYEWNHERRRRKRRGYQNAFRGDFHELEAIVAICIVKSTPQCLLYYGILETKRVEDDKSSMDPRQEVIDRHTRRQ